MTTIEGEMDPWWKDNDEAITFFLRRASNYIVDDKMVIISKFLFSEGATMKV